MKTDVVKSLLLCAASSFLIACGGDSGGSDTPSSQVALVDTAPFISSSQADSNNSTITEGNYVASASTFYNTTVMTALPTAVAQQLNLFLIQTIDKASTSRACSVSGEITTEVVKHPLNEKILHNGDSLTSIYSDCKDAFSTQSGTRQIKINRLEGSYESGEYVIHTDISEDINKKNRKNARDNGNYRYHLPVVYALTNNDNIQLIGINLSVLDANVAPNIHFPNAEEAEAELATANKLVSNPSYFSTPAATFNTFAFELIEDNTTPNNQTKTCWKFTITNKEDASASYSTKTTRQLILEDRHIEKTAEEYEEDGDYLETFALNGKFNFKMASGEIIYVQIFSPDANATPGTSTSSNVVVSFDNDGDGVMEAKTGLTWEEFTIAMFGFYAP